MSIHGTVTRTTEVKPELIVGSFACKMCKQTVRGVEQQFKFTEPTRCPNTAKCQNTSNWDLLNSESIFMDWQKIRVQEHSTDIPAGSMPRSIDIILRGDIVDMAKPGDRSIFTGTLVVVPDIVQLMKPGEKAQSSKMDLGRMQRNDAKPMDGVMGLRDTGVKDLSYKMVFIASNVSTTDSRFGFNASGAQAEDDDEEETSLNQISR